MVWSDNMVLMLRTLIQDFDGSEFTDARLKQILVVAAHYVLQEINVDVNYTIETNPPNISPDPNNDSMFVSFTALKAACLIDRGSMRSAALMSGLDARCGPVAMKVSDRIGGFGVLIQQGYCSAYDELRKQHLFGNVKWCHGILGPFTNGELYPLLFNDSGRP